MHILCAPDSFKESLTAPEAAAAMARGIRAALPDATVDQCPIADGGEGTVEALVHATDGMLHRTQVRGPTGESVDATWGVLGEAADNGTTAVIEMAAASGLALVPEAQRDPMRTSTFGTGQLMAAALDHGARRIILGIGGSATNDAGCGAAQALGVRFIDADGREINEPIAGGLLERIARIDLSQLDARLADSQLTVACDVINPLTGDQGAAHVYGPQKGATPEMVRALDDGLRHFAKLCRAQLGRDVEAMPGAGAAGGMGGGMVALLGATLRPGVAIVLDAVNFARRVSGCDLCLTGEGRLDGTSLSGKACLGVAQAAKKANVPTVAIVGCLGDDVQRTLDAGLHAYHAIGEGLPAAESMRRAAELVEQTTQRIVRDWSARPTSSE